MRPLTAEETTELQRRGASRTLPVRVVERARMIWALHEGQRVSAVARWLGMAPKVVRTWLAWFNADGLDGLRDRPRSGRPVTYGPDIVGEVIATALTKPDTLGQPFACWTLDRLEVYLNEDKGIPIKRSRIDERLVAEGLRWRTQETWFGERAQAPGEGAGGVSSGPPAGLDRGVSAGLVVARGRGRDEEIEEIGEGHRFIAVGTWAAWTDTAAEQVTLGTALLAEESHATRGALVDDRGTGRRPWQTGGGGQRGHLLTAPKGGLAAGR
ncbi:MAG: helix-turn-helix domain-containing protein [Chloroflexi bacterium]|nr:helix-turn-helix domain-containing protein [Chloroflexota bacterium]